MCYSKGRCRTSKHRGVILVEFCVAFFFVLLPLTFALIQYGSILQTTLALESLSREAGQYASANSLTATSDDSLRNYVTSSASRMGITIANPTNDIIVTPAVNVAGLSPTRVRYMPITITIRYDMGSKSFLSSPFTAVFKIPVFKSTYSTKIIAAMQ